MNTTLYAEASVLERIMHMLEEGSVTHLVEQDHRFADFIDHLYATVNEKTEALHLQARPV
jgi:hypothetical protein